MKKNLLLVVLDKGFGFKSPVYLSQYFYRFILEEGEKRTSKILIRKCSEEDRIFFLKRIPPEFTVEINEYKNLFGLLWFLAWNGRNYKIITRSLWSGLVCWLCRNRYFYDLRGDLKAESSARNGKANLILSGIERLVLKGADEVWAVSKALVKEYSFLGNKIIFKSYCKGHRWISDLSKFEKIFVKDQPLHVVYSGGLQKYQNIDAMLSIWELMARGCPKLKFTMLTKSEVPLDLQSRLALLGIESKSLPAHEVDAFLCRCDIAFLLREEDGINRVASPVKFADYLNAGLIIITTKNIAVVSENLSKYDSQILLLKDFHDSELSAGAILKGIHKKDKSVFNQKMYY